MLNKILNGVKTIGLAGHIRPDGDCVGSCMGMYQYLMENYPDISIDIYLEDFPERFSFIEATKDIKHEAKELIYDLFISLDCADLTRLGFAQTMFKNAKRTFCVDHHVSNIGYADDNFIDADASSASEMVYRLIDKDKISKPVAEALYLGIAHDTGVFQYSCAGPQTFRATADLLEKKINATKIVEDTFYEKTYAQQQILGYCLLNSKLFLDGKVIVASLQKEQLDTFQVAPKDLDGIVSQLRLTKGVEVSLFLYELDEQKYKGSLRAGDQIDVNIIASTFCGGGHKKAAGFSTEGMADEITAKVITLISSQFEAISGGENE